MRGASPTVIGLLLLAVWGCSDESAQAFSDAGESYPDGEPSPSASGDSEGVNGNGNASGSGNSEDLPRERGDTPDNGEGEGDGSGEGNGEPNGGAEPPSPVDCSGATLEPGDHELTLEHDGVTREYLVHVPPSYANSAAVPLVVDMHGFTSNARQQAALGWRAKADTEGFIVVHPQGLANSWNGGDLCCGNSQQNEVDDEGFIRALVSQMQRDACIDNKRVYATGLSNGGAMAHLLACNAADVFAAAAPVSMSNGVSGCTPARPISVVMTRGTDDPLVPFNGGFLFASAEEDFERWGSLNGCAGEPAAAGDLCQTLSGCSAGVEVSLCTLDAGHVLYDNAQNFNVPDFVWATFQRQRLP
jgi:polyhydroxybutyrate depolymerase